MSNTTKILDRRCWKERLLLQNGGVVMVLSSPSKVRRGKNKRNKVTKWQTAADQEDHHKYRVLQLEMSLNEMSCRKNE